MAPGAMAQFTLTLNSTKEYKRRLFEDSYVLVAMHLQQYRLLRWIMVSQIIGVINQLLDKNLIAPITSKIGNCKLASLLIGVNDTPYFVTLTIHVVNGIGYIINADLIDMERKCQVSSYSKKCQEEVGMYVPSRHCISHATKNKEMLNAELEKINRKIENGNIFIVNADGTIFHDLRTIQIMLRKFIKYNSLVDVYNPSANVNNPPANVYNPSADVNSSSIGIYIDNDSNYFIKFALTKNNGLYIIEKLTFVLKNLRDSLVLT